MAKKTTTNRRNAESSISQPMPDLKFEDRKIEAKEAIETPESAFSRGFEAAIKANPLTSSAEQIRIFRKHHANLIRNIELNKQQLLADELEVKHIEARIHEFTLKLNHAVDDATN